jgi:hypothetical protein
MKSYYVWVEGKNIVLAPQSEMVPTGGALEYELETSQPYVDKDSTLIKVYGNGSKPVYQQEINNSELFINLIREGKLIVFGKPISATPTYYKLYMNLLKVLKVPKFISLDAIPKSSRIPDVIPLRKKKSSKKKPKRVVKKCKCRK